MSGRELVAVVMVLLVALLTYALTAAFAALGFDIAILLGVPAVVPALYVLISWLLARQAPHSADASAMQIEKRDLDEDYRLNRNEMTAWHQRLSQTYHFTVLATVALLGFGLNLVNKNEVPIFIYALLFSSIVFVVTAGMAIITWTYSLISRQGAWLRVFYKKGYWIDDNRAFWTYQHDRPYRGLRWIRGWNEPRYVAVIFGVLMGAAALLLIERLISMTATLTLETASQAPSYFGGSLPVWLSLAAGALWTYRLWTVPDHARLWEQHWKEWHSQTSQSTVRQKNVLDMDKAAFMQAKEFIFSDIEREMQIAGADAEQLKRIGITPGGGNFLAALGLLCYTEFGGKLRFGRKRPDGSDIASENFNLFFDDMGPAYKNFRRQHNVYDIFRCGLAHEYYVKKSCTISMFGEPNLPGIGIDRSGKYWFVVENYCRDLENAFSRLEEYLFGGGPSA